MNILATEAPQKSIHFMDPASAKQYTVINQCSAKVTVGSGLYLVSTKNTFEYIIKAEDWKKGCSYRSNGKQATGIVIDS